MKRKWILVVLAAPALLVVLLGGIGLFIPERHTATCAATIPAPANAVFALIANFDSGATWRSDLERVERLDGVDGRTSWVEHGELGRSTLELVEADPPNRLVKRVGDDELPSGRMWTCTLVQDDGACRVSITEDGEIRSAVFRTLTLFVLGYHRTLERYLEDVGRHFGADVVVTRS